MQNDNQTPALQKDPSNIVAHSQTQKNDQMPEMALKCAQFFFSMGQYCLSYYKNYNRQKKAMKIKKIRKIKQMNMTKAKKKHYQNMQGDERDRIAIQPPKKPLTAYIIYFQQKKPDFVVRYPNLNLSELTKLIAKQWKQITQEEKKPYLDRAAQDRKRYDDEMIQFRRNHGGMQRSEMNEDAEKNESMNNQDDEIKGDNKMQSGDEMNSNSQQGQEGSNE